MKNKTENFWDHSAKSYEKIESTQNAIYDRISTKIEQYIKGDDIVLDFACGPGMPCLKIAELAKEIHAIDISNEMLEIAKRKVDELKIKNINFIHTNIFDKRLKNETYDIIIAFRILHLLPDTKQTINRVKELLKPGGYFISLTPCANEKMSIKYKLKFLAAYYMSKTGLLPISINRYTSVDVENLLGSEDFQILESDKIYNNMTERFIVAKK